MSPSLLAYIAAMLNRLVPSGRTWILVTPETGNEQEPGKTLYLSPVNDPKAIASQLRSVANFLDPQS